MRFLSRSMLLTGTASLLALASVSACAGDRGGASTMASGSHEPMAAMHAASADSPAASLRAALDGLLGEHVVLAAAATGAALNGREREFEGAAAALDANSVDVAKAIGSVYGKEAEEAFLPLWRSHIAMVVDYTVGTASSDKPKQDKAVGDLLGYTQDFGAFLNSANPGLPQEAVADLVKHHVVTLKAVIDAQASGDQAKAYMALRTARSHMATIAEALATAIAKQFPEKFA